MCSEMIRWGSWLADRLGLVGSPGPRWGRAELWERVDEAARLLLAPGPVYFSAAFLAGMATSFLVGLWVL